MTLQLFCARVKHANAKLMDAPSRCHSQNCYHTLNTNNPFLCLKVNIFWWNTWHISFKCISEYYIHQEENFKKLCRSLKFFFKYMTWYNTSSWKEEQILVLRYENYRPTSFNQPRNCHSRQIILFAVFLRRV